MDIDILFEKGSTTLPGICSLEVLLWGLVEYVVDRLGDKEKAL